MKTSELAHWRCRVKTLQRQIDSTNNCLQECQKIAKRLRNSEPRNEWDTYADELRYHLSAETWLLEEARYRVELEQITSIGMVFT